MSEIFKIVKDKKQGFTIVPNQLAFDENISLKSTMLLIIMLALPPTWDLTIKGLAKLKKDGIDSIRTGINELEKAGYISKKRVRNEKGQVQGTEYTVYETLDLNPKLSNNNTDNASPNNEENTDFTPELENPIQDKIPEYYKTSKPKLENPIQGKTTKTDKPKLDFPKQENPILGNPTQLNTKLLNTKYINQSYQDINININNTYRCDEMDSIDRMDRKEIKTELRKQLNYEKLISENGLDKKQINSIINILADTMSSSSRKIRIAGENKPLEEVIQRFKHLTDKHIGYVLECLSKNADKPRNIRAYLLTALFNAPSTIDCYYARDADPTEKKQYSFDVEEIKALTNSFSGP